MLNLLPTSIRIALVLAAAGLVIGGYLAWRHDVFNKGVAHERTQQKERDDEAVSEARKGRSAVRACYDLGGVWDPSAGICDRR